MSAGRGGGGGGCGGEWWWCRLLSCRMIVVRVAKYGGGRVATDGRFIFFFQAEDGIRDGRLTGVQTCALPILSCKVNFLRRSTKFYQAQLMHNSPFYRT